MHKSRLAAFVLDSQVSDIEQANKFWEQALGMPCVRSDEDWKDKYSSLETPVSQPNLLIQKVEHQSHIHLDIETDNIEAEVKRLLNLGASVHKKMERWVVMEAPTGHRFYVVQPQRSDFGSTGEVNQWDD
ncbi:VOC family protein [Shewanella sp. 202IG2-18]|uniref:VOC family protein n=1 Tax=Parashewanella hymeniacidonis TaxID=2807618 RepID=UPI0019609DDD|nr:VOC family protein [Parashewanella hymeniacidonis]MBM7074458.1 VOC family protein [Parashewanella hymeniacidonis]